MTAHPIPEHVRAAAVADYKASGDGYRAVAARHGISPSRLNVLVNGKRPKSRRKTWGADEIALTGGRWVNVRGVMRWETL